MILQNAHNNLKFIKQTCRETATGGDELTILMTIGGNIVDTGKFLPKFSIYPFQPYSNGEV